MEGPTDTDLNINKELSVIPEEEDESWSSISSMPIHDFQWAKW